MNKVLIADDNLDFNEKCCQFLTKENYSVISANTGDKAIELYLSEKPDIAILDLDMPNLDGVNVINILSSIPSETKKCNFIIVSSCTSLRKKLLNTSKVFRIIPKPFQFSVLRDTLQDINNTFNINTFSIIDIERNLLRLGFNLYSKGTRYLLDAIELCYYNPDLLYNLNDIYISIGEKYNSNEQKIEWSIRNSLSTMNRFVDKELLYSIFSEYDGRKIITKYFLTLVTEYYK